MKKFIVFVSLLVCAGCSLTNSSQFNVNVDSISSGKLLSDSKCVILPADPNDIIDQLQYIEYSRYIKRALEKKGYQIAGDMNEAEMVVFFEYGISEPKERVYSYSTPVWGQTGVSSSYTTGTIQTFGNKMALYSGTTTHTPTYGIKGYQSHTKTQINYTRFLILTAYDLEEYRKTNSEVQLWRTIIISTGSSGDLRKVFPVMIAASTEYIGVNTGKQIDIVLNENDNRVKEIKGLHEK